MSFWDFTRNVSSVRLLVELGRDHGMRAAALLRGTDLSSSQLDVISQ